MNTATPLTCNSESLAKKPGGFIVEFCRDILEAFKLTDFSLLGAYYEIKARYVSSYLGPLWIVASNAIFIGFISILYSSIFEMEIDEYIPYLTTGYLFWVFMVSVFLEGSHTFIGYGSMLKDCKISPLVLYFRVFYRAIIVFLHNLPVIFGVIFYFKGMTIDVPLLLIGLAINVVTIYFIGLAFAIVCCRFRDISYILPSVFQVLILMMPILWKPDMLAGRKVLLVEANFVYQLLELVRSPLLGTIPPMHFYINCTLFLLVCFLVTSWLYVRTKRNIVLWT